MWRINGDTLGVVSNVFNLDSNRIGEYEYYYSL